MLKKATFLLLIYCGMAYSSDHHMIDTLGSSSKGQYVALEEYGYKANTHAFYVTIKIMNVWQKEYVGETVQVELPAHRPEYLKKAREKARLLAKDQLEKYYIKG